MEAFSATTRLARTPIPLRSPRLLRVASDERLVALARAGVEPAFEAIYDRHHRAILSFSRHMLGSHQDGEDAVQQTFLSAHAALLADERPMQLRAWLYAIARNRCLSILRARREQPTGETIEVATTGLSEQVQQRQDLRDLLADLTTLPKEQRAALVLAEVDALSHEDIAGVLGVPRKKVKALVFQARESLIASEQARHVDCREIHEQIATLSGAALRRGHLRRHLALCEGCRVYKAEITRQRQAMAIILPVIPSVALKQGVLSSAAASGGFAATGVGSSGVTCGLLATGAKGVALKLVLAATVAAAGTAGTVATVNHRHGSPDAGTAPTPAANARAGSSGLDPQDYGEGSFETAGTATTPRTMGGYATGALSPRVGGPRAAHPSSSWPRSGRTPPAHAGTTPHHARATSDHTHTTPRQTSAMSGHTRTMPHHANPATGRTPANPNGGTHRARHTRPAPTPTTRKPSAPAQPLTPRPTGAVKPPFMPPAPGSRNESAAQNGHGPPPSGENHSPSTPSPHGAG
jgi:RNA polymerase sigma factor (sigma-70 family)